MIKHTEYAVKKLLTEKEADIRKIADLIEQHGSLCDRVTDAMPPALFGVSIDSTGPSYQLSGDKHDLAAAVRALRIHGFTTTTTPPGKNESSWTAFFYGHGLSVMLQFTSNVCRRIKVGTEMIERDVYETVCDETVIEFAREA